MTTKATRMIRLIRLTPRQILIVLHDLVATAAAILITFVMRFEGDVFAAKVPGLKIFLPAFVVYAAVVFFIVGLHRNKWRFTSVPDVYNIFRASTVLAFSILALDYVLLAPNVYGTFFFGKITILLFWFMEMFFLGGSRVAYRYLPHYQRTLQRARVADATPTLVVGRAVDAGSPAARHRKRSGQEDLAGRHPLVVAGRPRPVDPRHSGARRHRTSSG